MRQLASRCQVSCQDAYRAVCELERLGYVYCQTDYWGSLRAARHSYRQPIKETCQADPIALHIRIAIMALHARVTERQIAARACEFPANLRRQALKDLAAR